MLHGLQQVRYHVPGRFIWIYVDRWMVKIEFRGGFWCAVELDEFGGFRRRLYDGKRTIQ